MDMMMSQQEAIRAQVMELLTAGKINQKPAMLIWLCGVPSLRWRKRKLGYTVMTKEQRQASEADSKTVNERVDKVLAKRSKTNKGHKPAVNHPWRNMPIGKSATEGCNTTTQREWRRQKGTFLFGVDTSVERRQRQTVSIHAL
jgi:hypothetical protein